MPKASNYMIVTGQLEHRKRPKHIGTKFVTIEGKVHKVKVYAMITPRDLDPYPNWVRPKHGGMNAWN